MPHIVVVDVFAQVGQVEPLPAEERAVIAVQHAVQPAHHRPFQSPSTASGAGVDPDMGLERLFRPRDVLHDAQDQLIGGYRIGERFIR